MFYIITTLRHQEGGDTQHPGERVKADRDKCEHLFRLRAENGLALYIGLSNIASDPSPLYDYGVKNGAHSIEYRVGHDEWKLVAVCGARPI